MNERTDTDGELTLADVQHEHPEWTCWRGSRSGNFYARRSDAPGDGDYQVISETPRDLSKKINDAEAR